LLDHDADKTDDLPEEAENPVEELIIPPLIKISLLLHMPPLQISSIPQAVHFVARRDGSAESSWIN